MITRSLLLLWLALYLVAAEEPVNSRQQRILRRPHDVPGLRQPQPGPQRIQRNPNIGPKPASPPQFRGNPRPPSPPVNKKTVFNPPRPKSPPPQQPIRNNNDKSQPKVEYGFTPMNVGANGQVVSTIEQHNTGPMQATSETKKHTPLIINVQQPQQSISYQNNNQQKHQQFSSHNKPNQQKFQHNSESILKLEQNFGSPLVSEKPKEQHNFDQFHQNPQTFGSNGKRNSEAFPKIPPNFGHFENKNTKPNFDSYPKPPQNLNSQKVSVITQKVPVHKLPISSTVPFQTQQIPLSQSPKFPNPPQFHVPNNQFKDSKVINTGAQFHVQENKPAGQFVHEQNFQDKKIKSQYNQEQQNFPSNFNQNNFGKDIKSNSQIIQGQSNIGQDGFEKVPKVPTSFIQDQKIAVNNAQPTFGQDPIYHGNFKQHEQKFYSTFPLDTKINTQFVNGPFPNAPFPPKLPQPYFAPQLHTSPFPAAFNQDPKYNQYFIQDPKLGGVVAHPGSFVIPQLQTPKLQAQYQVQDTLSPIAYPGFKIPTNIPAVPQIFGQKIKSHPEQISIPVGTTFPFGVNTNPFINRGVVQGQVIPVQHLAVAPAIPQFTPLPQTLQFPAVENVAQSLAKDEQDAAASQTLRKVIAPPRNVSAISPAKPKKTTLKDILAEDCTGAEEFGYCASPPRYPTQQVNTIVKQCSDEVEELLESEAVPSHHISERANAEEWSWSAYENQEDACVSTAALVEPGYARDASGHWLVILQHQASSIQQRVNVDVCAQEGGSCGCEQHYETKNLIAWDPDHPNQCPVLKTFSFPSKCICPGEKTAA